MYTLSNDKTLQAALLTGNMQRNHLIRQDVNENHFLVRTKISEIINSKTLKIAKFDQDINK